MNNLDSQGGGEDQWGAAAEHWARAAEKEEVGASAEAAEWMLDAAGLQPGERVLEVAGGAGRVGLQAAAAVAPEGTVLCSDFSEQMMRVARERFERLEASNIETRVLDAQDLDLDGESFDVVLCRFGYMLMPDPLQALRESARVLRPGGRLVLAVWGEAEENLWLTTLLEAVMSHLSAPPPQPGMAGPFALGDPSRLRNLLAEAGLESIEVDSLQTQQVYDSLDAWWEKLLGVGGPLKAVLDPLPESELEAIRNSARTRAAEISSEEDGATVFPAVVLGAKAQKAS